MSAARSPTRRLYLASASQDSGLRGELHEALLPWAEAREVRVWHRPLLRAGEKVDRWEAEIASANVVVLLLSPSLFADPVSAREMEIALGRHMRGGAWVIPVLARPFLWRGTPLQGLSLLPSNQRPVVSWPVRDEAWLDVVTGIADVVEELHRRPEATPAGGATARAEEVAERWARTGRGDVPSAEARASFELETWMYTLCAEGDHAALRQRASEVADPEVAGALREMARQVEAGQWPAAMAPALLQIERTSAGWHVDVRLGFLGQVCSLSLRPGARAPLGVGATLEAEEQDGELVMRLAARAESALRGSRARVAAGLKTFTKWLIPPGSGALGAGGSEEMTLLEWTLSSAEVEEVS